MQNAVLKLEPKDNVLIALRDLRKGERVNLSDHMFVLTSDVPARHKFAAEKLASGSDVTINGVLLGKARESIGLGDTGVGDSSGERRGSNQGRISGPG